MKRAILLLLPLLSISFIGCANLQTISRDTSIPKYDVNGSGKAIHLDAQQRLVIVNRFQQYCAEPSPDALAAYASSLGLSVSDPSKQALSFANSLQSSTSNIGLRTQSITLMRDSLYRICEAYSNGKLNDMQVSSLLTRSQDYMTVILAVEQLTGTVIGEQVILGGSTMANTSASLLSNQRQLKDAKKDEDEQQKSYEETKKVLETKKVEVENKNKEMLSTKEALSQASGDKAEDLKKRLDVMNVDLESRNEELVDVEKQVETQANLLEEAKETREKIEKVRDSALANVDVNTTSDGQFNKSIIQKKELSKEATKIIADTTFKLVSEVLNKDYLVETCISHLTSTPPEYMLNDPTFITNRNVVSRHCMKLIEYHITKKTK